MRVRSETLKALIVIRDNPNLTSNQFAILTDTKTRNAQHRLKFMHETGLVYKTTYLPEKGTVSGSGSMTPQYLYTITPLGIDSIIESTPKPKVAQRKRFGHPPVRLATSVFDYALTL